MNKSNKDQPDNRVGSPADSPPGTTVGQKAAVDVIAGAAAGAFARTLVAPADRLKLLIQLQGSTSPSADGYASASTFRGMGAWDVGRKVIREEGVLALWRGNTPTVLIQAGTSALNFMFMDWYKMSSSRVLEEMKIFHGESMEKRRNVMLSSFISGGLAGGTTITVLYPLGFMRTRLAMDVGGKPESRMYPRGMRDVVGSIWKTDGPRGFYQGYGIALASVTLYRTVYLGGYDALKVELIRWQSPKFRTTDVGDAKELPVTQRFLAAQFVSVVASIVHYPLDSVRRRLMMQAGRPREDRMYRNSIECFREIYFSEGIRGFFLGLVPNLVRSIGAALVLVSYDELKSVLFSKCLG